MHGACPARPGTTTPGVLRAAATPRCGSCSQDYESHRPPRPAGSGAMAARARPGAAAAPVPRGPDTERLARVRPGDTVGALKRTYFPGQEQQVRLIYQGQLLRDDSQSLAGLHLGHLSVLHCHLSPASAAPAAPGSPGPRGPAPAALGVGSLALPLFVLLLALLWYLQLQHRHVFTATATTCLAGLTLLVTFVAFAMYRR
ncbi:transmembrane and ubiquitin-like domain-containing protein 1 [Passer montanus]|uniref:transmembrane and ubiquitin-like domain-containing protein 1 n=1 Tax=Passer montanus TaxID=9160 RepID=UPI00196215DE|nr:transmembrane and ubiquitin-like domain-containing protein 1 [Passer montanus]